MQYTRVWSFFKFHWILNQWEKHCKNTMSDLYFNEENVFWGKYKWQWRLSLYHSSSVSVWAWKEKKRVVMKAMRKKLNICTLQLPMIGVYTDIAKTKRGNNCLCCWEVTVMLIASDKISSPREASRDPAFMGKNPTIDHTCQPYLISRWVIFLSSWCS